MTIELPRNTKQNGLETQNVPDGSRTFLTQDQSNDRNISVGLDTLLANEIEAQRYADGFGIPIKDGLCNLETDKVLDSSRTFLKKNGFNTSNTETKKRYEPRYVLTEEFRLNDMFETVIIMNRCANLLFLLLRIVKKWFPICLFLLLTCVDGREQKFAIEPQDQSAVVGSRVTLPCRVENKSGQLQWTKDDFGLGTHRHLSGYERYMMIGSDEEGDYSLDIREVTLDDDGLYQCQVSTGPRGESAIRSRYARLIILAPPDPPRILQGAVLEAIEEREVKLECVSAGGKPAAEITWVDQDGGVLTQGVTYKMEPSTDGHRFTARSTLRLKPKRHHHNQVFTCQAQNTADRAYRAASIQLQVKYAPKVKLFVKTVDGSERIAEGDKLTIGCTVDANPKDVTVKWFVNNEQIITNNSKALVFPNVSRKHNDATVRCEVFNAVGKSSAAKSLEVTYGPRFVAKPQNVESEIGSTATLTCLVDGYPHPEILWIHYENDKITRVGKSSNLTVNVNPHTAGLYWCKGSVEGFPEIEAQAQIFIKGPPRIMSNKTQYGVIGDSVHVECISFAVPKPDYVLWSFGGHEINSLYNHDYTFLEEPLPEGVMKYTLIIHESFARHFGRYNCSVVNLYGMDSVEIHLMPDKSFPLVLIVSAGSSAAGLVAVLLLIIILCHRRRRKHVSGDVLKKPDVTDIGKINCDYKESDRNSNISDLKLELRHVEGSCEVDNLDVGCETEFHRNMHLSSNLGLGLPLAGPVSLPNGYNSELMKHYQRYSQDFCDSSNLHFKVHSQSNGYVPYVDYSKDYAPPAINSNESNCTTVRGNEAMQNGGQSQNGSLTLTLGPGQLTGGLAAPNVGPDVIPMTTNCIDVRYAATYGNPYLRSNQHNISYGSQVNTANPAATPAPPPYYTVKNTTLSLPTTSTTSPSSSSSSRPVTSPMASSSSTVSSVPPQIPSSLYVLPQNVRGSQKIQITSKVPQAGIVTALGIPQGHSTYMKTEQELRFCAPQS